MPANWRGACRTGLQCADRARGSGSTRRDSEAAGWHTTAHCLTLIPRRRVPLAGSVGAKRIKVGVFPHGHHDRTDNVCCVPSRKHSFMPIPPRCVPHLPPFVNGAQRSARPTNLTLRWWSETAGCAMKGQKGNRDRRPCSPTAECQTNLDL